MSGLFLTREELVELTGYKLSRTQKRWLMSKKLPYLEGGDGAPRVLRQSLLQRLKATEAAPPERPEPRLRF